MSDTASTHTARHSDGKRSHDDHSPLERKMSQAARERHDADIPSGIGYVLNEEDSADVEKGTTTTDEENDPNIVWWDNEDDPENPYNWSTTRKVLNCGCVSFQTFISPLASSIFAPGVPLVLQEFNSTSPEIATFVVSVYLLGFAAGPIVLAPLSEIYGRVPVYHACSVGFVAFQIACALAPSLNSLIAFRFLAGLFGVAPVTNGGGTIADMIPQKHRGTVLAVYSVGPLLGPIVGPIAGGFLSDAKGWRWNFWVLAIVGGFITIVMLFVMRESFAPVILQRKTEKLRKETNNELLRSKLDIGLSPSDFFKRSAIRPAKLFIFSPVVSITALYTSLTYGYLYIQFTTMTEVFQGQYGFSTNLVGLSFIGLGVGSLIGVFLYSTTSDKYTARKAAEADKIAEETGTEKKGMKPEYRLPLLPVGAVLLPIGLFIYGWPTQYKVHWIVPIIGTGLTGIGNILVFFSIQTYLVDAFTVYAASALASNTVIRSIAGGLLPLAGLRLYERLGYGWGNSLLAFIAILFLPVAYVILKYGETLREKYAIKNL
ncbi:cycloheximide resistance protein [Xylaria bambusicola]|uniref:cycloheximide resistance protein n=1 Tax=Xylaria bambusicola TaxID=326684 RepID=UPI002007E6A9|nr:cycloheximide resistance protein [Xylaria bambusicola]KAI0505613.1 cycloheximide resistance protein [Xylaria bambusicola]